MNEKKQKNTNTQNKPDFLNSMSIENNKEPKTLNPWVTFFIIFLLIGSCTNGTNNSSTTSNQSQTDNVQENATSDVKTITNKKILKLIKDEQLLSNLYLVFDEIDLDESDITLFKKDNDYEDGKIYRIFYKGENLYVYCNKNSFVDSIYFTNSGYPYLDGYEPYSVNNYFVDDSVEDTLKEITKNKVESHLNFPSSAKFDLIKVFRENNLYSISSNVDAKNAFGMEGTINFKAIFYQNENDTCSLIYFKMGSEVYVNNIDNYDIAERKEQMSVQTKK